MGRKKSVILLLIGDMYWVGRPTIVAIYTEEHIQIFVSLHKYSITTLDSIYFVTVMHCLRGTHSEKCTTGKFQFRQWEDVRSALPQIQMVQLSTHPGCTV